MRAVATPPRSLSHTGALPRSAPGAVGARSSCRVRLSHGRSARACAPRRLCYRSRQNASGIASSAHCASRIALLSHARLGAGCGRSFGQKKAARGVDVGAPPGCFFFPHSLRVRRCPYGWFYRPASACCVVVSLVCAGGGRVRVALAIGGRSRCPAAPQGWQLARRSQRCVEHVAAAGGLWLSLPCGPCPSGVAPAAAASACFCGGGSGSWASLAFALGQPGCSALVFCPPAAAWSVPQRFGCSRVGASPWRYRPARQGALF